MAYCLMNNHYHLLIETPEGNLVSGMRRLNGVYTQTFNRRQGRAGHLFQGRYKSIVVDKENYLLELSRYIVLNPVRAGIVKEVGQWKWSSYRVTIGRDRYPDWLETNMILEQFGKWREKRIEWYKRFVKDGIGSEKPWVQLRGQIWLGSDSFLEEMKALVGGKNMENVAKEQMEPHRPTKEQILEDVGSQYNISSEDLLSRKDKRSYRAGVYLLRRVVNLSLKEVANTFGISRPMVSKIQGDVERGRIKEPRLLKLLDTYKVKQ